MNTVVIPMAGAGSRFARAGYRQPKMMIHTADGRTILEWAILSLRLSVPDFRWVFVCLEEHLCAWSLGALICNLIAPHEPVIVALKQTPQGQLCAVQAGAAWIDPAGMLIIHNCDTYVASPFGFLRDPRRLHHGVIPVFSSDLPSYSYVDVDAAGFVSRVVEKQVLPTRYASVGTYHFTRAADFFEAAHGVVAADQRTRGEFYVSSVYHPLIAAGRRYTIDVVDQAWPIGTPEELHQFNTKFLAA